MTVSYMWLRVAHEAFAALDLPMGGDFINIGSQNDLVSCVEHTALASICH